jgi:glycerol-3-phosphate O-acyltransferase
VTPRLPRSDDLDRVLERVHARRLLQSAGLLEEPRGALHTDSHEVAQLLADRAFHASLEALAEKLGRPVDEVVVKATGDLRGMSATHAGTGSDTFRRFTTWLTRAYDVYVDDDAMNRLRVLDRKHSLLFCFSHRSYLDGTLVPEVVSSRGMMPAFTFGGANLNFFPMGALASRSGTIFIRRDTTDDPVYRMALRAYIAQLIRNRQNLAWSIEGGRTRTGKLRPPVFGILRYVTDALRAADSSDALVIPVSIVYDQLHEVSKMTTEARGGRKSPEDLRWLVGFAREQRQRLGRAYADFGEPLPLRERLSELNADEAAARHSVERIAVEICHRINRATPVTATAVVSVAMLGRDRALSLTEVLETVAPLAGYLAEREWPVAGALDLTDRSTIRRTLQELVASGTLTSYDEGEEAVWQIADGQHLVVAFYRNTAIHVFVERAIGEVALMAAAEIGGDVGQVASDEALKLRELLKFDFFFSSREEFGEEVDAELRTFALGGGENLLERLTDAKPHVAQLVLRPFLDAYHVVADRLAAWEGGDVDEDRLLEECLRVGRQWALQKRVASDESISLELFKTALRLAAHRGLLDGESPEVPKLREQFAEEIAVVTRRIDAIAELARTDAG